MQHCHAGLLRADHEAAPMWDGLGQYNLTGAISLLQHLGNAILTLTTHARVPYFGASPSTNTAMNRVQAPP